MYWDVVFVYINVINGYITGAEYQLDSAYVRSYLVRHNIKAVQYINKNPSSYLEIVNDLNKYNSRNFIFYINEYNYYINKLIINNLKSKNKLNTIFAFGPVIHYIAKTSLMKDILVDVYLLKDEFKALQEVLCSFKRLNEINNIAYMSNSMLCFTEDSKIKYSLDDIGLIYSSNIVPPEEVRNIGMLSSTGCFGNCTFCSYIAKNEFRIHSIESVLYELDFLKDYVGGNSTTISFFDDCFSKSTKRTIELCEQIKQKDYNFQLWCCTRADVLNTDLIDLLAESKFKNIVIGLESASVGVLSKLDKVQPSESAEDYLDNIKYVFKYATMKGINPLLSVNFGLPFEKLSDTNKTLQFIKDISATNSVSVCFMTSFPGSRVFENSEFYKIDKEPSPTTLPYRTYYRNYDMKIVYNSLIDLGILTRDALELISNDRKYITDFSSYFSGVFDNSNLSIKIKFIEIPDDLNSKMFEFIDKCIDINGIVISSVETIKVNRNNLFSDDRKRLKLSLKSYDDKLAIANKLDKYFPKMAFIKHGINTLIQPDDAYRNKPIQFRIKKLTKIEDLKMIEKRVQQFLESDSIVFDDFLNGIIENSCMFCGKCNLSGIKSVKVICNDVFICYGKLKVGNVNNSYDELLENVSFILEESYKQRECNYCRANRWCSKCIAIPSYLSEKEFCSFIKDNPFMGLYICVVNLISINFTNYKNIKIKVYLAKKYEKITKNKNNNVPIFKDDVAFIEYESLYLLYKHDNNKVLICNYYEREIALQLLGINEFIEEKTHEFYKFTFKLKENTFIH